MNSFVKILLILSFIILFCFNGNSIDNSNIEEEVFIASPKGVDVRKEPNIQSEIKGTLNFLYKAKIVSRNNDIEVIDKIKGHWCLVKYYHWKGAEGKLAEGWVFDGYLRSIDECNKIVLNYKIVFNEKQARNCCFKVCAPQIAECMKHCGSCTDKRCLVLLRKDFRNLTDPEKKEAQCCYCKGECGCDEGCIGGGSSSNYEHGWTPTACEWINNETLQFCIAHNTIPDKRSLKPIPAICK